MLSIKLIIRQLLRSRNISFFKLLSLVIGFTVSFLIFTHIAYQFTYDDFHADGDQIYRIGCLWNNDGMVDDSPIIIAPLATALKDNIPEIENYALIKNCGKMSFSTIENHFSETCIYADSTFFNFFSFPIIKKSTKYELRGAHTVMISESVSKRFFGDKEAVGQLIYDSNNKAYQVEGVFANIPSNSHLQFDIAISFETIRAEKKYYTGWDGGDSFTGYIKTIPNAKIADIESKIPKVIGKYLDTSKDETSNQTETFYFQELKDVNIRYDIYKKNILMILTAVGGIIIIISVLNYVLLSLSSFQKNLSKLGVQQCFGASKKQIISTVAAEHIGFVAFAVLTSIVLLAPLSKFTSHYLNWTNPIDFNSYSIFFVSVIICLGLLLSVGLPILKLYRLKFQLMNTKTDSSIESKGKKILLTAQMTGVITLLIMLLFVFRQLQHIEHIDMGYRTKGLAYIEMTGDEARKNCTKLLDELRKQSFVNDVSASTDLLLNWLSGNSYTIPSERDKYHISRFLHVDRYFFKALEMKMAKGMDFSSFSENDQQIVVINQKLAEQMNWDNPVGKTIIDNNDKEFRVVGVTCDFVMASAHVENMPCVFYKLPEQYIPQHANYITINLNKNTTSQQLDDLKNLLTVISPDYPLNLSFYDIRLAHRYETERELRKSISLFSLLAIILAIISLVGYISHEINLRTKEIGIRKVNGAKTFEVIHLLNVNFLTWIAIAFIIACPVSWYAVSLWLENFAYKTELSWWIFALAGLIAMGIALLTVSFQSWRAATRNPVESLRYE
ncbi:ABC transporter permease [Labilibaculum antarcticum]|uniref:ABC transporter permease n=1 Tax=Labilibaculum antarcticum TaxID=1717717 RepID=A0A1Y1CHA8_9BACT|nr:FtsX-like permease family protein [Labilibaculum antarcticum]BAX79756.1 hypothetical protein ALGA_1372 [Labilibaculum antarcticum]